jgi:hypothetical protein
MYHSGYKVICEQSSFFVFPFLSEKQYLTFGYIFRFLGTQLRSFARQLTAGSELFKSAKLQNNFHGREVRQMRFLPDAQPLVGGAPAPIIFASGGEDCRLRMFQCKW